MGRRFRGGVAVLAVLLFLPFAPRGLRIDAFAQPVAPENIEIEKYEVGDYTYEKVDDYTADISFPSVTPKVTVDLKQLDYDIAIIDNAIARSQEIVAQENTRIAKLQDRKTEYVLHKTNLVDTVKIVEKPEEVEGE